MSKLLADRDGVPAILRGVDGQHVANRRRHDQAVLQVLVLDLAFESEKYRSSRPLQHRLCQDRNSVNVTFKLLCCDLR